MGVSYAEVRPGNPLSRVTADILCAQEEIEPGRASAKGEPDDGQIGTREV